MNKLSARIKLIAGVAAVALVLPASAFAQATRTWVSGVGDDVNPCSRTAPCKTFAGAISKTARGGEINCLDPGGYGTLTITKSITIKCYYTLGSTLASSVNGFIVNITDAADTASTVTLRGLDINGAGSPLGLNGVRVLSAKKVQIVDCEIYNFSNNGIDFVPSNIGAQLLVADSHIHDITGHGVHIAPGASPGKAILRRNIIAYTNRAISSIGNSFIASVNAFQNTLTNSTVGVYSEGASSTVRIGENQITNNATGLQPVSSGKILSWGDNWLAGNGTDGSPTGVLGRI